MGSIGDESLINSEASIQPEDILFGHLDAYGNGGQCAYRQWGKCK